MAPFTMGDVPKQISKFYGQNDTRISAQSPAICTGKTVGVAFVTSFHLKLLKKPTRRRKGKDTRLPYTHTRARGRARLARFHSGESSVQKWADTMI